MKTERQKRLEVVAAQEAAEIWENIALQRAFADVREGYVLQLERSSEEQLEHAEEQIPRNLRALHHVKTALKKRIGLLKLKEYKLHKTEQGSK